MTTKANYLEQIIGENAEAVMAIREIPHFKNCSPRLLKLVYKYGRIFSLRHDEELTREQEFDQWVFFIIRGRMAVYVEGECVDTISSALVGERCILGEARKATLRAAEEGIMALGIDMAMLDALNQPAGQDSEDAAVTVELLSIIVGEIVDRVAVLSINQLDISRKYSTYHESEELSDIVSRLRSDADGGDRRFNLELYKYLNRHDRGALALCLEPDRVTVDAKKVYAHYVNTGRQDALYALGRKLRAFLAGAAGGENGTGKPLCDFFSLVGNIAAKEGERHDRRAEPNSARLPMTEAKWRRQFRLGRDATVDLVRVCDWLRSAYAYTEVELADALMIMLKEASDATAQINRSIENMLKELNRIRFIKQIGSAPEGQDKSMAEYFESRPVDEMIPMFSKNILQVHLINPYLDNLGGGGDPSAGGPSTGSEPVASDPGGDAPAADESDAPRIVDQSAVDALFD